ncbi:hypothetical protein FO519_001082 [Halicephalobus sp. NKZ332]|nr:hypothetical protein FO519_001082 [Halicephalobus sp. NKZ332]
MSSYCISWNDSELAAAREQYAQLFLSYAQWYNGFHSYIYRVLCVIGVLANIAIVAVLLRATMRRNPFNLFLIAIAICDMTLMGCYFVYYQVEMCNPWFFSYFWIIFTYLYAVLSVFVHSASLWLTVNMAVLRYLVLRGSARSNSSTQFNSYKAAAVSIILAIGISFIGSAPNMLRYEIKYLGHVSVPRSCLTSEKYSSYYNSESKVEGYNLVQPKFWNCPWERISFWTLGIVLKVIPCVLLTVFMALLVRMLVEAKNRRSRLSHGSGMSSGSSGLKSKNQNAPGGGKTQAERTTAMLILIVLCTMITELPQGILGVVVGLEPAFSGAAQVLGNFTDLLSLLNSSVNFILYSTMSNLFRREFLNAFQECCPWEKLCTHRKDSHRNIGHMASKKENVQPLTGSGMSALTAPSTSLRNHLLRSPIVSAKTSSNEKQEQEELLIDEKNRAIVGEEEEGAADENV